jgi:hypothetical protein
LNAFTALAVAGSIIGSIGLVYLLLASATCIPPPQPYCVRGGRGCYRTDNVTIVGAITMFGGMALFMIGGVLAKRKNRIARSEAGGEIIGQ